MEREDVRNGLEQAGLSKYQADALLTLLEQGVSPAVDVAKNCSVPTPRIYDVLKDLEQAGYVETIDRETLHARARNPDAVVEDLQERSERLAETASEIEERWERSPLGDHEVNVLRRADAVVDHASALVRDAETVVDVAAAESELRDLEGALAAVDDDVHVRASVCSPDPASLESNSIPESVTEVRRRDVPGPLLVIVDRTAACFAPTTRMPDPYGLVISDDIVSFVFQWYFQTCLWGPWDAVVRRHGPSPTYVSLDTFIRDIAPLWCDGATITVTVRGVDTESGESRELAGTVSDIAYTGMESTGDCTPTVGQLAGQATITIATGTDTHLIGSWGALFEDIEARRIVLRSLELESPRSRGHDATDRIDDALLSAPSS